MIGDLIPFDDPLSCAHNLNWKPVEAQLFKGQLGKTSLTSPSGKCIRIITLPVSGFQKTRLDALLMSRRSG